MAGERFTISGQPFDGYKLFGPTHGGDRVDVNDKGEGSATMAFHIKWKDAQRFTEAFIGTTDLLGTIDVQPKLYVHPYFQYLAARSISFADQEPSESAADEYGWCAATINFREIDRGEDDQYGSEKWTPNVEGVEVDIIVSEEGKKPRRERKILPFPTVAITITKNRLRGYDPGAAVPYMGKVNAAIFKTLAGKSVPAGWAMYQGGESDVLFKRKGAVRWQEWNVTHNFLVKPNSGWNKTLVSTDPVTYAPITLLNGSSPFATADLAAILRL